MRPLTDRKRIQLPRRINSPCRNTPVRSSCRCGGGGGGGGAYFCGTDGYAGGDSSFNGSVIGGGGGGGPRLSNARVQPLPGIGGTASGGDVNFSGFRATRYVGGDSRYAPAGVGAGGTGAHTTYYAGGGGGGAYAYKIYTPSQLPPGTQVQVVVGAGGTNGYSGGCAAPYGVTDGEPGYVSITWNDSSGASPSASCQVTFDQNPIVQGTNTNLSWTSTNSPDAFYLNSVGWVGASGGPVQVGPSQTTDYSGTVYKCVSGYTIATSSPPVRCTATTSAGSQTYSTAGAYQFTVPAAYGTMTVEVWGAGGAGGNLTGPYIPAAAGSGSNGDSSFFYGSLIGGGGGGGAGTYTAKGAQGTGGTASGGDTNTAGNPGVSGVGGSSPNGGAGGTVGTSLGTSLGNPGGFPGGGGGGEKWAFGGPSGGGGGGGYVRKTYTSATLAPGTVVAIGVGAGGQVGIGTGQTTGVGGDGEVKITWTGGSDTLSPATTSCTPNPATLTVSCSPTYSCTDSTTVHNSCGGDTQCASGYQCVPGQATCQCVPVYSCVNGKVHNSCGGDTSCPTGTSCTNGACVGAPAATCSSFSGHSGCLEARPKLVVSGHTTQLYWNITNAASCTVTSVPVGTSLSSSCTGGTCSSGTSGRGSNAVTSHATFFLTCVGTDGYATTSEATVDIAPSFQEQ